MGATKNIWTAMESNHAKQSHNGNSTFDDHSILHSNLSVDTAIPFPLMVPSVMFVFFSRLCFSCFFFFFPFRAVDLVYFRACFSYWYFRIFNICFILFKLRTTSLNARNSNLFWFYFYDILLRFILLWQRLVQGSVSEMG